jgi:hypothetical protein
MVVTGGDTTSDLVTKYKLGSVVPPGDEDAVVEALSRLLATRDLRETYSERFEQVRPSFTWERVCEPIARFCEQPRPAADRTARGGTAQPMTVLRTQGNRGKGAWEHQQTEIERLQKLVHDYEQGRFIRLMRQIGQWRERLGGPGAEH